MDTQAKKLLWTIAVTMVTALTIGGINMVTAWSADLVHKDELQKVSTEIAQVDAAVQYLIADGKCQEMALMKEDKGDRWTRAEESQYEFWLDRRNKLSLELFNSVEP